MFRPFRYSLLWILAGLAGLPACTAQEPEAGERPSPLEFRPTRVIAQAFPAIRDPKIEPDPERSGLEGNELVLGVVIEGKARAYPINMLTGPQREIINDRLGGRAIAATW